MDQQRHRQQSATEPAIVQHFPPCQLKCPIHEEIQRTNILIAMLPEDPILARPAILQIGDYLYEQNPFFTVCAYVCGLCELQCNYSSKGGAIRRRLLKRFITETYIPCLTEKPAWDLPHDRPPVAVIGGGPAGLMAGFELSRRGCPVTLFEADERVGGALWLIPHYRLPGGILDTTLDSLVRISGLTVHCGARVGESGLTLASLKEQGFGAVFVATGTPSPRVLTFNGNRVSGQELPGVLYAHTLLYEENHGHLPADCYRGRRAIVVGGGNVALDAARTVRRLGAETTVVCLESADHTLPDGIKVTAEELRGAEEEGINFHYNRGVSRILAANGQVSGISSPRCVAIFDDYGFNPTFDQGDMLELPADLLLIAVGQGPERNFLVREGLLDAEGKLAVDPLTLQAQTYAWVFIGGDLRQIGYLAEAMRDGIWAAESIDRFLSGKDLRNGRQAQGVAQEIPRRRQYRSEPEVEWMPPEKRLHFELYEEGFTLPEAIQEARRCLACGPCMSCRACLAAGLQEQVPTVTVNEDLCSGCGICVSVCPYGAAKLKIQGVVRTSTTDPLTCKGCGMCVAACPAGARRLSGDDTAARIRAAIAEIGGQGP